MTDPQDLVSALPADADASSAGAALLSARQAQKLSLEQVAERLKVSVHKLAALEADRDDALSDPVFARALTASVCRLLKIDAEPILTLLPRPEPRMIRVDDAGLNTRFHRDGHGLGRSWLSHDRTSMAIAVLVLMAAALAIVIWPHSTADAPAVQQGMSDNSVRALPAPSASNEPSVQQVAPSAVSNASIAASAGAASDAQPQPELAQAASVLMLKASGSSWVRVTDAKGVTQLHRTLQAGEQVSVAGDLPLSVVLGRADLVAVTVRNQPFDLSAVTNNHVARFEVKE